jgi:hypothetical protein
MTEKSYEEKLRIAKQAYKQIKTAIDSFEQQEISFCAYWDECISVNGEFFHGCQLRDED